MIKKTNSLYYDIEEYVTKFKAGPNNGRSPKRLESNFRFDPLPYQWTIYNNGNILTYGYCHTREQAEDMITRELRIRS